MKDRSGATPIHIAAARGNKVAIEWFLSKVPGFMRERDKDGRQAVHLIASSGHADLLECYLSNPTMLTETDGINATIAHYAAAAGKEGVLEFIMEKIDADMLSTTDWNGNSVAHWAARGNKVNSLRFISIRMPHLLVQRNRENQTPVDLCWDDGTISFLKTMIMQLELQVPPKKDLSQ
eukprot:CAMPEP_0173063446 /NCGR_PEP_ID=MMETSP1102-20130122/4389_1 /TAXON_ID=49646 /ORGANISM="Geminigera sp., Strain Caron Lab Isolate" /LENGTH=177 /DNA_ID=CAMNT_0013930251 /DNA_START=174 /DNA_END=707 /DNA_ORIENTATION=+